MGIVDFKEVMVMGAGGVGGYFGGKLADSRRCSLSLIARGDHLKAIQQKGLTVRSIKGDFVLRCPASDRPDQLPHPDLILFTVKSHDTERAIELLSGVVDSNTQILSLQNGIENELKLAEAYGRSRVFPGVCRIGAGISEPGVITHTRMGEVIVGEWDGRESARTETICRMFRMSGVQCRVSHRIRREMWIKFVWNAIFNMLTAAEDKTVDLLYDGGTLEARLWNLAEEIHLVADAEEVELTKSDIEEIVEKARGLEGFVTSTLHDLRAGKKLEYDAFTGALLRLGEKHGLKMPHYKNLHHRLERLG